MAEDNLISTTNPRMIEGGLVPATNSEWLETTPVHLVCYHIQVVGRLLTVSRLSSWSSESTTSEEG
jgi:hypothetical protein